MTRGQKIECNVEKAMKAIEKMKSSRRINYTVEKIKASNELTLQIEATRDNIKIGGGKYDTYGKVSCFEIYAVKNKTEVDVMTCQEWDNEKIKDSIRYLLNCWL